MKNYGEIWLLTYWLQNASGQKLTPLRSLLFLLSPTFPENELRSSKTSMLFKPLVDKSIKSL